MLPSELTEGGRRLYSEDDLKRMKIICFLRELDLPIDAISQILKEEHPEKVISILIEQQELILSEEISEKQVKLEKLHITVVGKKAKTEVTHRYVPANGSILWTCFHERTLVVDMFPKTGVPYNWSWGDIHTIAPTHVETVVRLSKEV